MTAPRHCFLILATGNAVTLSDLIHEITRSHSADVILHIDAKSVATLGPKLPLQNVTHVIANPIDVKWAGYSMVEATDKLISAGLRLSRAPRFTLLSDSCFPSQPLEKFYAFVERDDREFVFALDALVAQQGLKKRHLMGVCFFDVAALNPRRFRPGLARSLVWEAFRLTSRIPRLRRSDFVSRNIVPYFGSQWWTLSRACLEHVASPPPAMLWFKERLRWSYAGDEFFIPTAVMNSPFRQRVHQLDRLEELMTRSDSSFYTTPHEEFCLRYSLWDRRCRDLPKHLNQDDLPLACSNGHFFVRKVVDGTGDTLRESLIARVSCRTSQERD
jgi:hypothetical protein